MARGIRHMISEDNSPAMLVLPADLLVIATSMLHGVARVITSQLDVLDDFARMHANRMHERAEFAEDVISEIERLP